MLYIAIAGLIVGAIGATRGWWEPRVLGRGSRGRDASSELLRWVRQERDSIVMLEMSSKSVPTADLVDKWRADVAPLLADLPSEAGGRTRTVGELLEHADRLQLRKDSGWITVATFALGDLERAAERASRSRSAGSPAFPSRQEMLGALERGQNLQSGLAPLLELVWAAARRAESTCVAPRHARRCALRCRLYGRR
jgi:hypothetical protein